ncbi:putative uncharacterized protein [Eggerthella sp. CAG:1427]|nr:putative uncharacterized protein [Eggerthella sp. CAG:1427]
MISLTFSIVLGSFLPQIRLDDGGIGFDVGRAALGDDLAVVQHADALADTHDQIHVVLDEQNGDLEGIPDAADVLHQLRRLGRVHARRRLVQQQQQWPGGQRPDDLQTALCAVGQTPRLCMSQIRHAEEVQHLQRRGLRLTLRLAVAEAVGHGGQQVLPDAIVHPHLHIVDDAHIVVQPDILEGTGDAHAADLMGGLARRWHPIDEDAAPGGLIDAGEEVKDRGLPGSVGADQSGDLRAADGESEVIHGGQTAEIDAQSAGLQHGGVADITLRHQ